MLEKLTKIKFDDERLPDLNKGLEDIDSLMRDHIDHQNIEEVGEQLAKAAQLLHITGRLTEIAVKLYEYAKSVAVYRVATHDDTKKLGTTIQVKIAEGLISDHAAIYERTMRTIKSLTTYLEGMRSILSKNKEQQRIDNYNSNT